MYVYIHIYTHIYIYTFVYAMTLPAKVHTLSLVLKAI